MQFTLSVSFTYLRPLSKLIPMRYPAFLALVISMSVQAGAQDLHFSQFYHHPLQYNPALTGVFRGDLRASGLYRSQWTSVPVSYSTFSGIVDWKTINREANMVSIGLMLQHDRAGDAALSWTQVGATAGVAHALGENQALSAGAGLALVQRSFDISGLKFRNQWTGELYDPNLPTGENFNKGSGLAPSFSAGLNWHYGPVDSRTRLDAELAHHRRETQIVGRLIHDQAHRPLVRVGAEIDDGFREPGIRHRRHRDQQFAGQVVPLVQCDSHGRECIRATRGLQGAHG